MIETTHINHIGLVDIGYMILACAVMVIVVPLVEWYLRRS